MNPQLITLLKSLDLTQVFKGKGELRRWSAKRTIGGVIVAYALTSMNGDITTNGIILCGIGILPLCLSVLQKD